MQNDPLGLGGFNGSSLNAAPVQAQPRSSSIFSRILSGVTAMPRYFGGGIIDSAKLATAAATGNQKAAQNAGSQADKTFGLGPNGNNYGKAAEKLLGNTAQLGLFALPGAGEGAGLLSKLGLGVAKGAGFGAAGAAGQGGNLSDITRGAEIGGVTGGALEGAGSLLGKITGGAANKLAGAAADKTANTTADEVSAYSGLNGNTLINHDLAGVHDTFTNKLGMDMNPATLHNASDMITGNNGVISNTVKNVLKSSDVSPVSLANLVDGTAKSAIQDNGVALGEITQAGPAKTLYNNINAIKQDILGNKGAVGNEVAPADAVFSGIQKIESRISKLAGADSGTPAAAEKDVLQAVKNELWDRLTKTSGVNDVVSKLKVSPDIASAIQDEVLKRGGTPQLASHAIDTINNAGSLGDLRSAQAPFVNANNLATAADQYAKGPGFVKSINQVAGRDEQGVPLGGGRQTGQNAMIAMRSVGGGPRAVIGGSLLAARAAGKVASSPAVSGFISKLGNAASTVGDTVGGQVASKLAIPVAVSATGASEPRDNQVAQSSSALQPQGNQSIAGGMSGNPMQGFGQQGQSAFGGQQKADETNPLGISSQDVFKAMVSDLANGGKNYSKLTSLYNITKAEEKSLNPQLPQAAVGQLDAAQSAQKGLQSLNNAFSQTDLTGGATGLMSQLFSHIPGGPNSIKNIDTQINTVLPDVAKALGLGTSPAEQKKIVSLLPNAQDSPQSAQTKINNLMQQIQQYNSQYFSNQSNLSSGGNMNDQLTSALSGLGVDTSQLVGAQ